MRVIQSISALLLLAGLTACEPQQTELSLVTPMALIDREIAADFSALFGRESTISIRLTGAVSSDESALDDLIAGRADLALVSNNMPFRSGIATVMPLYPTVLHIGYRGDRDTSSGASLLSGAKVFAGAPGSVSRIVFEKVRKRLKLAAADFSFVEDGRDDWDVIVVFAPISPDRLDGLDDVRLFSLGSPDSIGQGSAIDATALLNPQLEPFVIPIGTYGAATPEPVLTVAVDMLLVARDDLETTVVYDLVRELLRLQPALAAMRPGLFRSVSDQVNSSNSTFVRHSGLLSYTERDAPTVYERYSGVAEVVVTIFIGLVSAFFAGMRIYKMRRKNRIDVFYTNVLAIRKSFDETTDASDLEVAVQKVKNLQNSAFEMLVDEKLAADESFRIFISLSNDVLQELERP